MGSVQRAQQGKATRVLTVAVLVLSFIFPFIATTVSAQAVSNEPPQIATFDFSQTTRQNNQFTVSFSQPIEKEVVENAENYAYSNADTTKSRLNLVGAVTISYQATQQKALITVTDPTIMVLDERVTFSLQSALPTTVGKPVASLPPTKPGVPTLVSASNTQELVWAWNSSIDPGENASGVVHYAYELRKDEDLIIFGQVSVPTLTLNIEDDGEYVLLLFAVDGAGNVSEQSISLPTIIDTVAPEVAVTLPVLTGNTVTPTVTLPSEPVTVLWTVDATSGVTISNAESAQPVFTFLADGTYDLTLNATDVYGNTTITTVSVTYMQPFIPGSSSGLDPIKQPEPVTAFIDKAPTGVLPAYTANEVAMTTTEEAQTNVVPSVPQTSTVAAVIDDAVTTPVTPTAQGWRILGLLWYWWLIIIAIIVTAWLWGRSVGRSQTNNRG